MQRCMLPLLALFLTALGLPAQQFRVDVLANAGFESPSNAGTQGLPIGNWVASGNVLVRSIDDPSDREKRAPRGRQVCRLGRTHSISQTFNPALFAGDSLCVTFLAQSAASGGLFSFNELPSTNAIRATLTANGQTIAEREYKTVITQGRVERRQITYTHPFGAPVLNSVTLTIENNAAPPIFPQTVLATYLDDIEVWQTYSRFLSQGDELYFDFEDRPTGGFTEPTMIEENWSSSGSVQLESLASGSPMPSRGTQFLEISSDGTNATLFPPITSTVNLYLRPQSTEIEVDWVALTNETPGATNFFDLAELVLTELDDSGSVLVDAVSILDTRDATTAWQPSSEVSASTGAPFQLESTGRQTAKLTIDPAQVGKSFLLQLAVTNEGDGNVESAVRIDNVRSASRVRFPGSDPDLLRIATSVDPYFATMGIPSPGRLTGGPGEDQKTASGGQLIQLACDTYNPALDFLPYILVFEFVATGSYPSSFPELGFWMTLANSQIAIDGTQPTALGPAAVLGPAGVVHSFQAPFGLFSNSVLVQFLVPTNTVGQNGFFVSSDTHEIRFR